MEIHKLQQLLSEMSLQEKIGQMVQLTGVYFDKEAVLTGVVDEQLPPEWIIQYSGSVLGVIGKEKISGTLENLKENDVIKMNYSLTDENYKYSQFNLRDTKTKNIKITEEMNNTTISRKDYIQII